MTAEEAEAKLAAEGLKIASATEPGWFWKYSDENGDTVTLWVTD